MPVPPQTVKPAGTLSPKRISSLPSTNTGNTSFGNATHS